MLSDPCRASKVRPPRPAGAVSRHAVVAALALTTLSMPIHAQRLPPYLDDRGTGIATSMFGEYVRSGEWLLYPFYEYTSQSLEYKPSELGFGLDQDFRGKFREHEALIFLAYGVSERLALELESVLYTTARLRKDPSDPSAMPAEIRESGFGDTQAEARWRWARETQSRPEIFSYLEIDFPFQRKRRIIGTQDWEYKLGTGVIKGFSFGTITARAAAEYEQGDRELIFGEYALEYLKRLSPSFRFYTGIEGNQDEIEWIIEGQYWLTRHFHFKLNSGFGLTSKAPDFAPEIGIMVNIPADLKMYPRR
jgi:hypothetical protein